MIEYISEHFLLILTIGLFLIFALIGFLVDTTKKNKEQKKEINDTNLDSQKEIEKEESNIPIDTLVEEKQDNKKKEQADKKEDI